MSRPDILVRSGQYFNFLQPEAYRLEVEDIAHGLSNICRFAGQCREFYSVAQHSVYASRLVPPRDARAALFHDCAEAFLGDVSRPLKKLLPDYQAIEKRIEQVLFAKLGIPFPLPPAIKTADMRMLYTEQKALMPMHSDPWEGVDETPTGIIIHPLAPLEAFDAFMERAREVSSWMRESPGDPYCIHCGKTWDMHICNDRVRPGCPVGGE